MPKFMCTHSFAAGQMTREQAQQIASASQKDPMVKGERSFLNLTEGKVVCVWESPNRQALATWFNKMKVPYDDIVLIELEGHRGKLTELSRGKQPATV